MYPKVVRFMIDHWNASVSLSAHDSSGGVRGEGVSIDFDGQNIRPDVFGIIADNGTEIPLLGEGKQSIGGHDGMEAFGQALAYKNLGMLSFVFFPEKEFTELSSNALEQMCRQFGIGLLKVPSGSKAIKPDQHIVVDLFCGRPADVPRCIGKTLGAIKNLDQKQLAHIYPSSLRDFVSLFGDGVVKRQLLEQKFSTRWDRFAAVLQERPYDPMVRKKLADGDADDLQREYFRKFLHGLLALGIIESEGPGFRKTVRGRSIAAATEAGERFKSTVSPTVARHFGLALIAEFEDPVLRMIETIQRVGMPVSRKAYCTKAACGEVGTGDGANWFDWRDREKHVRPKPRCPRCGSTTIEPGLWGRQWIEAGERATTIDYSVLKFAAAVGVVKARPAVAWADEFPGLRCERPDGTPMRWHHFWLGDILTGAVGVDEDDDE